MSYFVSGIGGAVGGIAAVLLLYGCRFCKSRGEKRSRRIEFSKIVLLAVLTTYFVGFAVGIRAVYLDPMQLSVFLTYVATPTATVIGFYSWKAKAENVVKIRQMHPDTAQDVENL